MDVNVSPGSQSTIAEGFETCIIILSPSGIWAVTSPHPDFRAAPADNTAAPIIPLDPTASKACPNALLSANSSLDLRIPLIMVHETVSFFIFPALGHQK